MRAESIRIHNFRSLADVEVALSPHTLLVGANNAGKSNVIDAIRIFYEKEIKYEAGRDFPKFTTNDQESWIEIAFRPSSEEFQLLKDEYRLPGGTFRVRKYLQSSELDADGKSKSGISAYVGGELSTSRFYGAKNVQQGKFGEVIYVPAVSKLDDHTKLSGPSALRDLINAILKSIVSSSPAYGSLKKAFDVFEGGLKNETTEDGQSLSKLEAEITAEIAEWGTSFELLISPVSPDELVKTLVGHRIQDSALGQPLDSRCYGQGFQRHLIFALIKLAALHSSAITPSARNDFSPRLTWILFEEPEAFLHPSQVDTLDFNLHMISQDVGSQVLISTHNPQFVSKSIEDLPSLARLCRNGSRSGVGQIGPAKLRSMLAANQDNLAAWVANGHRIEADDMQLEMESVKYALWLNPLRCCAFFANRVLLVEGQTEAALLQYMLQKGLIPNPPGGVFFLDTLGKWNIHRFMNLFEALRIPHAVLCDYDNGGAKNAVIHKTIEDSKNKYTLGIEGFDDDIESFLGIPRATRPDRKPQHVMWHLIQESIDKSKLDLLATKVRTALRI
jgi:putative ATP-dependent endonuclease of the OLD family